MAARVGGKRRINLVTATADRLGLLGPCRGFDLDFGITDRAVAKEPVEMQRQLAVAQHADQFERLGGGFETRRNTRGKVP